MFNSVLLLRPPPWRWPSPISPRALRVLLLALAVIDDLGARVVIALFYSTAVSLGWLLLAVAASAARSLR